MPTAPPTAFPTRHLLLALLLAACVVVPRAALVSRAHSETIDENYHLVRGVEFLQRDPGLVYRNLNDPPLGAALAALPLWIMGGTTHGADEGTAIHAQPRYTPEAGMLAVAIWKSLLFLPLVAVAFCWCHRLYGLPAGWLAVGLLLVEPTLAGHLHLAALDVVATAGIVLACAAGWRYFDRPTTPRLLAASLACAAALLLKHTAILVPVILCGYGLLHALRPDGRPTAAKLRSLAITLTRAALLTALFLWPLLAFDLSPVRKGHPWPAGLYIESVLDAARQVNMRTDGFLHGEQRAGGWWYYFPVVATYKVPLGIAAIILLALVSLVRTRPRWEEWSLLLPFAAYAAFMMLQRMNIGWRHFLPAYVFLLLLSTRCLVRSPAAPDAVKRPRLWPWALPAALALVITAIDTTRWHPDYIPYVNWPRPNVHLAISDSNIDWGQSLKQARQWLDQNQAFVAGRPVYIRPFVTARRAVRHYLGTGVTNLVNGARPPTTGVLILNPVSLAGVGESQDAYAFLRDVPPHAIIGHTLRVYDLDKLPDARKMEPAAGK